MLQSLELRTQQALGDNLTHGEFLLRLLTDEVERRDSKQLEQRVRRANFEHAKTIEDFDFHFNTAVPKAKILDLATCAFVQKRQNVLLIGPTGVGKSHIGEAVGHRACRAGYTVLYTPAHEMLGQLRAARADSSYDRRLLRFTTPELLIIDDLGLRPLSRDEPIDLYEVIRARYERTSTIITSNRDVGELGALFGDPLLAAAAMDRLLHGAHVIVMEGASYRNPPPRSCEGGFEGGEVMTEILPEDQFGRPELGRVMGWITPLLATAIGGSVWPPPSGSGTPPFDTAA